MRLPRFFENCHPERSEGSLALPLTMRDHNYYVYIVTNKHCTALYIGMTNDLERRMVEHKRGEVKGFTQRYALNRLVWFEHFPAVNDAIACEKRLKGWLRAKKNGVDREIESALDRFERRLGAGAAD